MTTPTTPPPTPDAGMNDDELLDAVAREHYCNATATRGVLSGYERSLILATRRILTAAFDRERAAHAREVAGLRRDAAVLATLRKTADDVAASLANCARITSMWLSSCEANANNVAAAAARDAMSDHAVKLRAALAAAERAVAQEAS